MNCDVMVSDVIVTEANGDVTMRDVNKPIARKRYAPKKHSLAHLKGILKSSVSVYSQSFTKMALILVITITILGGMFNVTLLERKSAIGTSSSLSSSSVLAELLIPTRYHGYSALSELTLTENVLVGKRLEAYIFPIVDFWASRVFYLDTYTVNLDSDSNFMAFYELVYVYVTSLPWPHR